MAESGGAFTDQAKNKSGFKVSGERAQGPSLGGDFRCDEEARIQPERQEVQGEVGEHQQVLQESEGEQQEEARGFQDLSLLPSPR